MTTGSVSMDIDIALSLTNGGRSLKAIWMNGEFDTEEKIILLYIASGINFSKNRTKAVARYVSTIAKYTGLSIPTVRRRLKSIEEKGYVTKEAVFRDNGGDAGYKYKLTDLLFIKYAAILKAEGESEQVSPPSLPEHPPVIRGNTPPSLPEHPPLSGGTPPVFPQITNSIPSSGILSSDSNSSNSKTIAGNSARKRKLQMDLLYKAMRQCYRDKTPGEITRGLVIEMLLACNDDRSRVLEIIKREASGRPRRVYDESQDENWLSKLNPDHSPVQEPAPVPKTDWAAMEREAAAWRATHGSLDMVPY